MPLKENISDMGKLCILEERKIHIKTSVNAFNVSVTAD